MDVVDLSTLAPAQWVQHILKMWVKDSVIDDSELDIDGIRCAKLHAKYLGVHSHAKRMVHKSKMRQKKLLLDKWEWYNGKMHKSRIDELGWVYDPLDGKKVLKGDMNRYYDADPDIQESENVLEEWKLIESTVREIIDTIRWRHQTIKNMIEFKKFRAGV